MSDQTNQLSAVLADLDQLRARADQAFAQVAAAHPEAMACGCPVLCSRYNGCWPELVREGESGWTFDPLDAADLAQALGRPLAHRASLQAMGEASRAIARHHGPACAAAAILDACRIAAGRGGAP